MNVKFFRCAEGGNLVELIENGGGKLVCCGQPMKELIPGTTDAAVEKHVPAVKREGNTIHVQVGSVAHPMTEAHLIQWIEAVQDGKIQRVTLTASDAPTATFQVEDGPVDVYEYCNLHGLWKAEA